MSEDLRRRNAPLEMSPERFRELGHRLVDEIAGFLGSLREGPVTADESPTQLRKLLPAGGLPEQGQDPAQLLEQVVPLLTGHSLFNGHPRFLGYITSSAAPIGALADMLAAAVNPNVGGWQLSPIASEIEGQCVRWIAEMLGYPDGCGGLLVSGGNMANFSAFLAARRARGGERLRSAGVGAAAEPLLIYASAETHTWIQKAADLFGHGTEAIRWIPVDSGLRIDLGALAAQIDRDRAAGARPFLLVGNGGTVSTGAVDPLAEMAALARDQELWFHVDGAYGAFAVVSDQAPPELAALAEADSVAVDPHKWLYSPLEAGCVLVREPEALREAFSYTPPYYRFTGEEHDPRINYYECGMQNSRGFRALKVWLGLRQAGREGYRQMIGDDIRLARRLHERVAATDELEGGTCELSVVTFCYVPGDLALEGEPRAEYLDRLNELLLERLKRSGEAFLSNAVIDGRFVLRACIVNFRTALDDVEALPEIVLRHGHAVHAELQK